MELYWHPFSIFPRRVRIALLEKGVACEDVIVDVPRGGQRSPEFLRLNPFGQVPVLRDGDLVIAESIAILEYLEERYPKPALLPAAASRRALTRQLMLWSGNYLAPAWKAWTAPRFSSDVRPDDPSVQRGHDAIAAHLDVLEARLAGASWLVDDYSLADVCYAPLVTVFSLVGLDDLVRERPGLRVWIERLGARPAVRSTMPSV